MDEDEDEAMYIVIGFLQLVRFGLVVAQAVCLVFITEYLWQFREMVVFKRQEADGKENYFCEYGVWRFSTMSVILMWSVLAFRVLCCVSNFIKDEPLANPKLGEEEKWSTNNLINPSSS